MLKTIYLFLIIISLSKCIASQEKVISKIIVDNKYFLDTYSIHKKNKQEVKNNQRDTIISKEEIKEFQNIFNSLKLYTGKNKRFDTVLKISVLYINDKTDTIYISHRRLKVNNQIYINPRGITAPLFYFIKKYASESIIGKPDAFLID